MPIVSGSVHYMERRKLADYEHRECKAELSFTVPDDGEYRQTFDLAAAEATAQVRRMLQGFKASDTPASIPAQDAGAAAAAVVARAEAKDGGSAGGRPMGARGRPPKAKPVPPVPTIVDDDPLGVNTPASAEVVDDAFVEDDPTEIVDEAEAPPITDADVQGAIQATMKRLTDKGPTPPGGDTPAQRIRKLIYTYAGAPPKRSTDVPVEKRREFLEKLEAL